MCLNIFRFRRGNMINAFIIITICIIITNALEPANIELAEGEARDIVSKHLQNIPDIENQYIVNNKLSKVISRYFKGKVNMLPLYKISLKIDRNPIKIPWSLQAEKAEQEPLNT